MVNMPAAILNKQVIQTNPLIEARKCMNLSEMRLFILGLQDIKPHIKDNSVYDVEFHDTWIAPSELEHLFDGNTGGVANLKRYIKKAFDGKIELTEENGGFTLYHIYEKLTYMPEKGLLIKFDNNMKPYILDIMGKAYTRYSIKTMFPLTSEYAWRILESLLEKRGYLRQGHKEVFVELTMEEVRFRLNVPDELYKGRIGNFRSRVLNLPIREINEKTDYVVWYEVQKTGRKVSGFKFWLKLKEKASLPIPEKTTPAQPAQPTPEQELERLGQTKLFKSASEDGTPETLRPFEENGILIAKLSKYGILPESAEELIAKYGSEQVEANLKYATAAENKHGKKSMAGWIINCVKQDYAAAARVAESLSKQEAERERAEMLAGLEPLQKPEIDPNDKRTVKEQFADLKKKLRRGV